MTQEGPAVAGPGNWAGRAVAHSDEPVGAAEDVPSRTPTNQWELPTDRRDALKDSPWASAIETAFMASIIFVTPSCFQLLLLWRHQYCRIRLYNEARPRRHMPP